MQKGELNRKIKEDKDGFEKFKSKKVKELMKAKKQNIKKDNQIRKLTIENNRKNQHFRKKQEELNRAKRINDALKNVVKPPSNMIKRHSERQNFSSFHTPKRETPQLHNQISQKYCE